MKFTLVLSYCEASPNSLNHVSIEARRGISSPALPSVGSRVFIDMSGGDIADGTDSSAVVKEVSYDLVSGVLKPFVWVEGSFIVHAYKGTEDEIAKQILDQFRKELVPNLEKSGWEINLEPSIIGAPLP